MSWRDAANKFSTKSAVVRGCGDVRGAGEGGGEVVAQEYIQQCMFSFDSMF